MMHFGDDTQTHDLARENETLRAEIERLRDNALSLNVIVAARDAEIERLTTREKALENTARLNLKVAQDRGAEIERLRASLKMTNGGERQLSAYLKMEAEVERLRAALQPFARNADAVSLSEALGHIEREHLHKARAALEPKP